MNRRWMLFLWLLSAGLWASAADNFDNPDTIVVARDGTGQFRTVTEALEVCRVFMDYRKVVYVKVGTYKEKVVVSSWLTNVEICGEDRDRTIITYDDHANVCIPGTTQKMGTFRTYTLKIEGNDIVLKNLTIENNSARLGQAVALHTEGDRLRFVNCRFLGHQDTIYTGVASTRCYFENCYIEGTTDFIFGPATAWFENCDIYCKHNSYITAASTPEDVPVGYVFDCCRIKAAPGVTKVYLGRPWRPYAHTLFMNCELCAEICPEGWHNWRNPENEKTVRYQEYNNTGEGARVDQRVPWSRQLTKKEASAVTLEQAFRREDSWLVK